MKLEDAIRVLKQHELAQEAFDGKRKKYVLSGLAECLIENAQIALRKEFPQAKEEEIMNYALIIVALAQLGEVDKGSAHVFVNAMKYLSESAEKATS